MARITNENCLPFVDGNHFDLVHEAVKRAKAHQGLLQANTHHKTTVLALKEIQELVKSQHKKSSATSEEGI